MSSKETWVESVKSAVDDSHGVSLQEYHDGLIELMEDFQERYQLASDDLERAEEQAEGE